MSYMYLNMFRHATSVKETRGCRSPNLTSPSFWRRVCGNNSIIRLNGQTISNDLTIDADENGMSAGPITQSATVTVNGYWSIV